MDFTTWLAKRGVTLQPWAEEAGNGLLRVMREHRDGPTGKTFLMVALIRYAGVAHSTAFDSWLQTQGITLRPWQKAATDAFFAPSPVVAGSPPSKTLLIKSLANFISEYGSTFEIPEEDDVQIFISQKCRGEEGARTTVKSIYGSYLAFCKEKGFRSVTLTRFIRRVKHLRPELEERVCRGMRCWIGVRV